MAIESIQNFKEVPLGDLLLQRKERASSEDLVTYRFIGMDDVRSDGSLAAEVHSKEIKGGAVKFYPDDIIYGRLRPYQNKVAHLDFGGVASTEFLVFSPVENILQRYLRRVFRSQQFVEYATLNSKGDRPRISIETIYKFTIKLPPIDEQRRVCDELDLIDESLERLTNSVERIKDLIKISKGNIRNRLIHYDYSSSQHKSDTIGRVVKEIRYGTSKKCSYEPRLTPVLRIPNLKNGQIDADDMKYASFDQVEFEKLRLKKGDVLVIRSNGSLDLVGRPAIVTESEEDMLFAGYLIRLRPDAERIEGPFLIHALETTEVRNQIELAAKSTSGVNNLNAQEIESLKIPLPPLSRQSQIVELINEAFQKLDTVGSEVDLSATLIKEFAQRTTSQALLMSSSTVAQSMFAAEEKHSELKPEKVSTVSKKIGSIKERFAEQIENWPRTGRSFEEISDLLGEKYEDIRTVLFDFLSTEKPVMKQIFDTEKKLMMFLRVEQ